MNSSSKGTRVRRALKQGPSSSCSTHDGLFRNVPTPAREFHECKQSANAPYLCLSDHIPQPVGCKHEESIERPNLNERDLGLCRNAKSFQVTITESARDG